MSTTLAFVGAAALGILVNAVAGFTYWEHWQAWALSAPYWIVAATLVACHDR